VLVQEYDVASGTTDVVTIKVKDAAGNIVSGLPSSDFNLSFSGGTSEGTFGAATQTATPGTYTVLFTGVTAGTISTLDVEVEGVLLNNKPALTVLAGAVSGSNSTVSFASSTVTSGTSDTATIVVEDAAGNAITGLENNNFIFSLAGGTSTGTFGTVTATATPGTYTVVFTGGNAGTASTLTVEVDKISLSTRPTIQVT